MGDLGSSDGTVAICHKFGAIVVPFPAADNHSEVRNQLLSMSKTGWNFSLQPWEIIIAGHDLIKNMVETSGCATYRMQVLRGQVITKEIRLSNKKLKFSNPLYESITDDTASDLNDVIIYVKPHTQDHNEQLKKIERWKKNKPTAYEPYYYHAFILLEQRKYHEFIIMAEHYLFHQKQGIPSVMMRYYLAMVYLYEYSNVQSATKYTLECLATRPLMAEFWCLLGDIYYKTGDYEKAAAFYENAKILGGKRLKTDEWPLEITKYKQHPDQMLDSCKHLLEKSKIFTWNSRQHTI